MATARAALALLAAAVLASGIVAALRHPAYVDPSRWGPTWRTTTTALFALDARPNVLLTDEEIYLGTLQRVRRGADFYAAQHAMFDENPGRWNTRSPLAYRLPALTWIWAALGNGGVIGVAFGVLAATAMVAAWLAACALVRPLPALLAPLALGLVFALENLHPPRILYAEMWAAPFVVIAGAMCALGLVGARASGAESRGAWLPGVVGAGCAFAAMAIRELAALPAAWMLFSLVIDRRARARRAWMPWLVAVVAWACVYAWHASRVAAVSLADPFTADAVALSAYVHPGVAFLAACVRWAGTTAVVATVIALLAALAIAGLARLRDSGIAWLATGSTLGVVLLLVVAGTPGRFPDGSYTGYWGFLFVPLVVAWCPLGLRLLPGQAVAAPRERAHSRDRGR